MAVRTSLRSVRTKTTEGQYSTVRSRASEVTKLFIIWMIVSLTKGGQARTQGSFQFLIFQIISLCTAEKSVHISIAVFLCLHCSVGS